MTEEERFRAAVERIEPRAIIYRARSLQATKHRRTPNWAFVMDLYGLGSTFAWHLCREQGIDPEALTLTPYPPREPAPAPPPTQGSLLP